MRAALLLLLACDPTPATDKAPPGDSATDDSATDDTSAPGPNTTCADLGRGRNDKGVHCRVPRSMCSASFSAAGSSSRSAQRA